MRRFQRRGQHEIQFNWLFALVGGFLFLLFFFIVIRSVLRSSEDSDARSLSFAVESAVRRSATSPETFFILRLRDADYRFSCTMDDKGMESYVRVNSEEFDEDSLRIVPVFSPALVSGDELFITTKTLEAPFPVGSLVMLANNRTRFVLVGQTPKTKDLKEDLAGYNAIQVGSGGLGSIKDDGSEQVRFIFYGVDFQRPDDFLKKENTALVVTPDPNGESGTLTFYNDLSDLTDKKSGIEYYGRAMLDAAIFSDDADSFACNMAKAEERLAIAAEILERRIDTIASELASDPGAFRSDCSSDAMAQTRYATARSNLGDLKTGTVGDHVGPDRAIEDLVELNSQLSASGCPGVY